MSGDTIDHATLSRLAGAGALKETHVIGQPGGWAIRVRFGTSTRTLAAQRSRQIRLFRTIETLVSYLKGMGISHFDVDAAEYEPDGGRDGSRPDRSDAMKRVHEAAEYDAWFRKQVAQALQEADNPATEWTSHDVIEEDMEQQRADLLARIESNAK